MEEDDEEVSIPWIQKDKSETPDASLYRSIQSNLNIGSWETSYQSIYNTLCDADSVISSSSMHSAISMEEIRHPGNVNELPVNNESNATVIDGSCINLRNDRSDSRVVSCRYMYNKILNVHIRDDKKCI